MKQAIDKKSLGNVLGDYGALIAFVILFVGNSLFTKNFFALTTVQNIVAQSTTTVLLGVGMTVVIATGGINISIGSVMALCAMTSVRIFGQEHIYAGMLVGLALGIVCGALTGYIIIKFDIQPMIVSLSFMFIFRGIPKLLNGGNRANIKVKPLTNFLYEYVGPVPVRTVIWLVLVIIVFIIVAKTRFGICIEAFGDNPRATRVAGIDVVKTIIMAYAICNVFACVAGYIEMGYSTVVDPSSMGNTKEMDAIAATVLGGTSIDGGKPHIWGTVMGAMVLQIVQIMVNMNNVPASYAKIVKAVIIILAIYLQGLKKNK